MDDGPEVRVKTDLAKYGKSPLAVHAQSRNSQLTVPGKKGFDSFNGHRTGSNFRNASVDLNAALNKT